MAARICMAGVGAVGATVAARLAASGESVSLLARGARLAQLRRDGLRVELGGQPVAARLSVSDRPEFGIQDIVFIATKAQGLGALLPTLGPLIGPRTIVAPLVNGIPWWYFQGAGGAFDGETVAAVDPPLSIGTTSTKSCPGRVARTTRQDPGCQSVAFRCSGLNTSSMFLLCLGFTTTSIFGGRVSSSAVA